MASSDILPHLSGGPVLACFGLSDTPKLRSALRSVVAKYPNITLVCFERGCYEILRELRPVNVGLYPYGQREVMKQFNVIGALVGDRGDASGFGLREMRV